MKNLSRFLALALLAAGFTLSGNTPALAVDPPIDPMRSRVDQLQEAVQKVEHYQKELQAKLDAAKAKKQTARANMLHELVKANEGRLVKVRGQLAEAQAAQRAVIVTSPSGPTVVTPAPVVVTPRPPMTEYEIGVGVGYMGNGMGVVGEVSMPHVFSSAVLDDAQKRAGIMPPVRLGLSVGAGYIQGSNPTTTTARYAPLFANGLLSYAPDKDYEIYVKGGINLPVGGAGTGLLGAQAAVGAAWSPSGEMARDKIFIEAGWAAFRRSTIGTAKQVTAMLGYRVGF